MASRLSGLISLTSLTLLLSFCEIHPAAISRRLTLENLRLEQPVVLSAIQPFNCPNWYRIQVPLQISRGTSFVLVFGIVTLASFALLVILLKLKNYLEESESSDTMLIGLLKSLGKRTLRGNDEQMKLFMAMLFVSMTTALVVSVVILPELEQWQQWTVFVPKELQDCRLHTLPVPVLFPHDAAKHLSAVERSARRQYFGSVLVWLVATTFLVVKLVSCVARLARHGVHQPAPTYTPLQENPFPFSTLEYILFHVLCVALVCTAMVTGCIDADPGGGVCWEIHVSFVSIMLLSGICQAFYLAICLPTVAAVPDLAMPAILTVTPVLSEPVDSYKDWLFVGLALQSNTILGYVVGILGLAILVGSGWYLCQTHLEEIGRALSPIRSACFPGRKLGSFGFLVKQTSPAKLATALTEDFPQSILQVLFVLILGGSGTQYVFIALSFVKILLCVFLRATALELEDRHGEAYSSKLEYYRLKMFVLSFVVGPRHPWALGTRQEMAKSLGSVGRFAEALQMHQEVWEARLAVFGSRHLETLEAQTEVAFRLQQLGRHAEALPLLREVLKVKQEVFGTKHPSTLLAQHELACCLGDFAEDDAQQQGEALQLKQEVFEVRREVLGPKHPLTTRSQHEVAFTLANGLGQYVESLKMFQEVFQVEREVLGPKHPGTLRAQREVGCQLSKAGRFAEALEVRQEVLQVSLEVIGSQHPEVLRRRYDVARSLSEVGRWAEALDMSREVVQAMEEVFGPRHPDTLKTSHQVALCLGHLGRWEEALQTYQELLEARREVLGPNHAQTLLTEEGLAHAKLEVHQAGCLG